MSWGTRSAPSLVSASPRRFSALLSIAILVLFGACSGSGGSGGSSESSGTPKAALVPDSLVLTTVTAEELHRIVETPGARATLVNVWASWCQPCREEFPDLVRLARSYEARGFRLVFVSADFDEDIPAARKFLAEQGVDWPTYLKTGNDMQFINSLDDRWSGALPGSFLYDEGGRLRRFWEGKADYATIEKRLLSVLEPSSPTDSSEEPS
ncbi:MAG: TlpA family protein disulfide reductase [Candidatus Eiseniibacteriota bacterium]